MIINTIYNSANKEYVAVIPYTELEGILKENLV